MNAGCRCSCRHQTVLYSTVLVQAVQYSNHTYSTVATVSGLGLRSVVDRTVQCWSYPISHRVILSLQLENCWGSTDYRAFASKTKPLGIEVETDRDYYQLAYRNLLSNHVLFVAKSKFVDINT